MNIRTARLPLLSVLLLTFQLRAQDPIPNSGAGLNARFRPFDKNGDGRLTREEFSATKIFGGADSDKDGRLTPEEIAAYFRKQQSGTSATPPDLLVLPSMAQLAKSCSHLFPQPSRLRFFSVGGQ